MRVSLKRATGRLQKGVHVDLMSIGEDNPTVLVIFPTTKLITRFDSEGACRYLPRRLKEPAEQAIVGKNSRPPQHHPSKKKRCLAWLEASMASLDPLADC
jgi:hypothetical protein